MACHCKPNAFAAGSTFTEHMMSARASTETLAEGAKAILKETVREPVKEAVREAIREGAIEVHPTEVRVEPETPPSTDRDGGSGGSRLARALLGVLVGISYLARRMSGDSRGSSSSRRDGTEPTTRRSQRVSEGATAPMGEPMGADQTGVPGDDTTDEEETGDEPETTSPSTEQSSEGQ